MKPKEIQDLLEFIAQSGLEEVSLETEQFKLAVKRNPSTNFVPQQISAPIIQTPVAQPQIQAPVANTAVEVKNSQPTFEKNEPSNLVTIKSPMIGTFYAASGPDSPNFVNVGDEITKGQVVCIIEAMKLFNEIESDVSGRVVKILVSNATPVEFDQPLFLVEPK
ncbi:MAG: acetyl-CoA carboxylase biotin carboxyl carrier protein [Cytophagales bacterium]